MRFEPLGIEGAWVIEPEPVADERGSFARVYDRPSFRQHALPTDFELWALSISPVAGTLRGMHFQRAPHAEAKLVRCARGRLFDVVVDLRPASPTYLLWRGRDLDDRSLRSVFIPRGCAHGFLTLEDNTVMHYAIDRPHAPAAADGIRWDDPAIDIHWPFQPTVVSHRDAKYTDVADRLPGGLAAHD